MEHNPGGRHNEAGVEISVDTLIPRKWFSIMVESEEGAGEQIGVVSVAY